MIIARMPGDATRRSSRFFEKTEWEVERHRVVAEFCGNSRDYAGLCGILQDRSFITQSHGLLGVTLRNGLFAGRTFNELWARMNANCDAKLRGVDVRLM